MCNHMVNVFVCMYVHIIALCCAVVMNYPYSNPSSPNIAKYCMYPATYGLILPIIHVEYHRFSTIKIVGIHYTQPTGNI